MHAHALRINVACRQRQSLADISFRNRTGVSRTESNGGWESWNYGWSYPIQRPTLIDQ